MKEPTLRVLSLGAGVQSTTVLLLSCKGELPKLDAAIFADTQWEPEAVYRHLEWLEREAARHDIPVYRVTAGSLREQALSERRYPGGTTATAMPFFTRSNEKLGMLPRQCTRNFKVRPIRRKLRELAGRLTRNPGAVEQWIGISREEASRMRDSDVAWITNRYPLVFDRPMRRADCLIWLKRAGYPEPPKSACVACPMHDQAGWRRIKEDETAWADACAFDAEIRERHGKKGALYVHRSGLPLLQVDLRTPEEKGQLSLWDMECEGHCGV